MPADELFNKRIPELASIGAVKSHYQMVIYSPDTDTTYRVDAGKLAMGDFETMFEGFIIYPYTGASGNAQEFTGANIMVESGGVIYKLVHPARPYGSTDLAAEVTAGHWVAVAGGEGGATYLNDLLDVNTDTAATGQVLYRSGLNWINRTLTAADVGALTQTTANTLYAPISHNHDLLYASINHNHDSTYAPISHTHSGYAPVNHTHLFSLDELTDVAITSPANGQIIKRVNGVWVNAAESGALNGAVLLAPTGAQTIEQGATDFRINRTGTHAYTGSFNQSLLMDINGVKAQHVSLDGVKTYSSFSLTPYSFTATANTNGQARMSALSDNSTSQVVFNTANSQMQTVTYNSDLYTVMYWRLGEGQFDFDSNSGIWNIKAKDKYNAEGTFSVRPTGLYWNNSLISFGGSGATTLDGLTDVTVTNPLTGHILQYNGTGWNNIAGDSIYLKKANPSATTGVTWGTGMSEVMAMTEWYVVNNGTNNTIEMGAHRPSANEMEIRMRAYSKTDAADTAHVNIYQNEVSTSKVEMYAGSAANQTMFEVRPTGLYLNNVLLTFGGGGGSATILDDLTDVAITTPANGQVLTYNGSTWVNSAPTAGTLNLDGLTDVVITSAATNHFLRYNGTNWVNQAVTVPTNLDSLTDVVITGAATNQFVRYNGTNWVNQTVTIPTNLDSLTDVVITSPANQHILLHNGTNFVNQAADTVFLTKNFTSNQALELNGWNFTINQNGFNHVDLWGPSLLLKNQGTATGQILSDEGVLYMTGFTQLSNRNDVQYYSGISPNKKLTGMGNSSGSYVELNAYASNGGALIYTQTAQVDVKAQGNALEWYLRLSDSRRSSVTWQFKEDGLYRNGTLWGGSGGAGATNLDGLTDVVITTAASGHVLNYNGTNWVNSALAFSALTGKPTTLAGYGITDASASSHVHAVATTSTAGFMSTADKTKLDANVRSKTPIALTNAATVDFNLANGYNFTWAISAGNKIINPLNHENGDNWAIDITSCAGQVLTLGPTAGYTHRVAGQTSSVTTITLPSTGTITLLGRRIGTEIRWTIQTF